MENFIVIDTIWQLELSELKLSVLYKWQRRFLSYENQSIDL